MLAHSFVVVTFVARVEEHWCAVHGSDPREHARGPGEDTEEDYVLSPSINSVRIGARSLRPVGREYLLKFGGLTVDRERSLESHTERIPSPPVGWTRLAWFGPGFLWMVSAAGSGELLFTPGWGHSMSTHSCGPLSLRCHSNGSSIGDWSFYNGHWSFHPQRIQDPPRPRKLGGLTHPTATDRGRYRHYCRTC